MLLANELVTNAMLHARRPAAAAGAAGRRLHIAVRDGSPRLLRLVTPNPETDPEAELARAWGVHPHPGGGKAIWGTLKLYRP